MFAKLNFLRRSRSDSRKNNERRLRMEPLENRRVLATFMVTTTDDVVDPNDGVVSLREAVTEANDNPGSDTIKFRRGGRGTINLSSQLEIADDVKIVGPGARRLTISGESEGTRNRVFLVNEDVTARFQYLTIADGLAEDAPGYSVDSFAFGGGIYNQGGVVHLSYVTMRDNQAGTVDAEGAPTTPIAAGGAIANEFGGVLRVKRSQFLNNSATAVFTAGGGAITSDRGDASFGTDDTPAPSDAPEVTIQNSQFRDNSVNSTTGATPDIPLLSGFAIGGAVLNLAGAMQVQHSTFARNVATAGENLDDGPAGVARGGAIASMDFSPFGSGDAITNISFSVFHHNEAHGGDSNIDVGGKAVGGAVAYVEGAEGSIRYGQFRNNVAMGGDGPDQGGAALGGAIGLDVFAGVVPDPIPMLQVRGSNFLRNRSIGGNGELGGAGQGGALGVADGAQARLRYARMLQNEALGGEGESGGVGQGGAVFNGIESQTTMQRSVVMRNRAMGGAGSDDDGVGQGGGLFNELDPQAVDGVFSIDRLTRILTRRNSAGEGANRFGF